MVASLGGLSLDLTAPKCDNTKQPSVTSCDPKSVLHGVLCEFFSVVKGEICLARLAGIFDSRHETVGTGCTNNSEQTAELRPLPNTRCSGASARNGCQETRSLEHQAQLQKNKT